MSTLNAKVILNVKTAAEWANSMEILLEGELGIESDTRLIKVGNGVDTYISLPYTAASDINDIEGVTVTSPTDGNVLTYSNGEWVNITPSSLPADTDLSHYDNTTSGFITASDIPALPADTDLSHYDNSTSDFATVSQIPTDVSQLNNDAGYITSASIPSVGDGTITIQKNSVNVDSFTTNQNTNKTINITVPTLLSELSNDVGYITSATLPTVNDATLTIQRNGTTVGTFTANAATNSTINISVPTSFSDITSAGDLLPSIDVTYNLGSSSYRWNTLYVCNIYGGGSSIEIDGNVYPKTDATDILGGSSNRWREIYGKELYISDSITLNGTTYTAMLPLSGGEMTGNITVSGSHNLGSNTQAWSTVYAGQIKDNSNTLSVGGNNASIFYFKPTATSAINILGSSTDSWEEAYIDKFNASSGNTYVTFDTTIWPSGDATINLGGPDNRWRYLYLDTLLGGPTGTVNSDTLLPTSSSNLGSIGKQWGDIYLKPSGYSKIYFGQTTNSYIQDVTNNTLLLHAYGQIVNDSPCFRPNGNDDDLGHTSHRWKTVYYTTLNPSSDIRLKDNIEPLESGLKIVNDLDIKSFTFKNSPDHIEYGIIAQDVVEKYPELISVPDSEEGTYGTYLHNFIFASIRAIQELSSKVDELNAKLKKAGL